MNLSNGFRNVALLNPRNTAIEWQESKLLYGEMETQVARMAMGLLSRHNLKPGAKIAIVMENCPEFLIILMAVWRAGLVAVPINVKLHPKELTWIFQNAGIELILASQQIANNLDCRHPVISLGSRDYRCLISEEGITLTNNSPNDPAWIFYTSGTTGKPKGAILTHKNLLAMCLAYYADVERISPTDLRLHAAPMSHGSGLYALPFLLKGANNLISPFGFDPDFIFSTISQRKNVAFFAAPTMIKELLRHSSAGEDVSGLKTLCYGGAPMYYSDCKQAIEIFGASMYQLYGQGESPMTISNVTKEMHQFRHNDDYEKVLNSVGVARTGSEIAIFAPDKISLLNTGEIGEIATRSECVMDGYLNNPSSTKKTIVNGWLFTGDMGTMSETGLLTLKDRSKDMIISGGMNIYPREIENLLLTLVSVDEVAVIGAPNAKWGEEVIAFVVGNCSAEVMDQLCLKNLARFKRPKRYFFVEKLPKNNYGKIIKTKLRILLENGDTN